MRRYSLLVKTLLLGLVIFSLNACELNRLQGAQEMYDGGLYAGAIQELDGIIQTGMNGAIVTRAELLRSNSYLELGKTAVERDNRPLAIRFLKLANSEAADIELANLYFKMAEEALDAEDRPLAKMYLDSIIREMPESPILPQVLLRRMSIYMIQYQDRNATWEDYKFLYDNYPNNAYEIQARYIVKQFTQSMIDYALRLKEQEYYDDALRELFELSRYPVVEADQINILISDIYQAQAEEYIDSQDYMEADRLYRIAVQYDPAKESRILERLEGITDLYIEKGDNLLKDRDFEGALIHYNKTFEIIPDYAPALAAIERLHQIQRDIKNAADIFENAQKMEAAQKYADAQELYKRAYNLDQRPEYQEKAAMMQNMVEAQRDPQGFARRILADYRNGRILNRVAAQRALILEEYKLSEIRDSGWKFLLSTGQYKYEARYDILTPTDTYLYVWQINLKDRSVIPLNKLSEALMQ
jgi:hypothetical protein